MQEWPLLDLKSIYSDLQYTVKELAIHVEALLDESEGLCPPDGAELLTRIAAVQTLVGQLISPALCEAIRKEQDDWDLFELTNPD